MENRKSKQEKTKQQANNKRTTKRPTSERQANDKRPTSDPTMSAEIEQMRTRTQAYFNNIESNMVSIVFAHDESKKSDFLNKEEKMMRDIMASPYADTFQLLLLAEYKERVYESIYYPHMDKADFDMMSELERLVLKYYGQQKLDDHEHDPQHAMFNDGKHFYMFYEMVESKGKKILKVADEQYDDYCDDADDECDY